MFENFSTSSRLALPQEQEAFAFGNECYNSRIDPRTVRVPSVPLCQESLHDICPFSKLLLIAFHWDQSVMEIPMVFTIVGVLYTWLPPPPRIFFNWLKYQQFKFLVYILLIHSARLGWPDRNAGRGIGIRALAESALTFSLSFAACSVSGGAIMKINGRCWNCLCAIIAVWATGWSTSTDAVPVVSGAEFGQLDWYEGSGLIQGESSWGRFDFDVSADPTDIYYLNVRAGNANGLGVNFTPADDWIIQNVPLFSGDIAEPNERNTIDFNIRDLGLSAGTNLQNLEVEIAVTLNVLTSSSDVSAAADPVLTQPYTVGNIIRNATGTLDGNGTVLGLTPSIVGEPSGHKSQTAVDKKNIIQHKKVPAVQENLNECLPGSFARSIKWLDHEYDKFNIKRTAQQILDDLKGRKVGANFFVASGKNKNTYEDMVASKLAYVRETNSLEMKVLDIKNLFNFMGIEVSGISPIDFLFRELKTEDVELDYGHHIITVTGIYKQGKKIYIKFRDDETQGNNALGDTGIKRGQLTKGADGFWEFRRDPVKGSPGSFFDVRVVFSESVPEPSSLALFGAGIVLLLIVSLRGKRALYSRSCVSGK